MGRAKGLFWKMISRRAVLSRKASKDSQLSLQGRLTLSRAGQEPKASSPIPVIPSGTVTFRRAGHPWQTRVVLFSAGDRVSSVSPAAFASWPSYTPVQASGIT